MFIEIKETKLRDNNIEGIGVSDFENQSLVINKVGFAINIRITQISY